MRKLLQKYNNSPIQTKASLWFLICAFLQKGISVITTPIFTRLLSTAEYGQYNVFNSWLGVVGIFVTLNIWSGVYSQGLIKFSDQRKELSSSFQGLTTVLFFGWTVVYLISREFWNEILSLSTIQVLALLVISWTTAIFGFWSSEQRVEYKYRTLVFITLIVSVAKPLVGILLVINAEDKVTARILGLVLVDLVAYSGLYIAQMFRGRKFYHGKFWKYALCFNIPLIPHYLSLTVLNSSDRIMIERMVGASEAGIYSLAYAISIIMTLFNTALMQTISPWLYQKIKAKQIGEISSIAYITMIIIATVNLLLIALAPEAVALFAPSEYYEAIWIIPPVAMSTYFMYCYDLFVKFAFYYEKTKLIMFGSVTGALLNIILNYVCIGKYGYQAAGYTTLVCYIVFAVGHYMFMNKICNVHFCGVKPYSVVAILGITLVFLTVGFLFLFTYGNNIIRYVILGMFIMLGIYKRKTIIDAVMQITRQRRN